MASTDLVVNLVGNISGLRNDLNKANSQLNGFKKSVTKIGGIIGGAFAAYKIAEFGAEAFKLSQTFKGIDAAFGVLPQSEQLIKDLTKATGGAVSQMRLMQMAVQAVNLGIDQNHLAKFFQFATIRAAETGESVDHLVNSIVTGVGRGSVMILDNLGISTQQLGAGFASAANKAEIVAGVIDGQLAKSALTVESAVKGTDAFGASWDNLQLAVGNFINSEAAQGALGFFAKMIEGMAGFVKAITFTAAKSKTELENIRKELFKAQEAALRMGDEDNLLWLSEQIDDVNKKLAKLEQIEIASTKDKTANVAATRQQIAVGKQLAGLGSTGVNPLADEAGINALDGMLNSIQKVNAAMVEGRVLTGAWVEGIDSMGNILLNTNSIMESFAETMAISFGQALGDAISGTGNFGASMLAAVGGFMQELGQMMVTTAIQVKLFKDILINNPLLALAGGIALIAAGRAFSNSANAAASNMGGGGGGGASGSGIGATRSGGAIGLNSNKSNDPININFVGKIDGDTIRFLMDKNKRNKGIYG